MQLFDESIIHGDLAGEMSVKLIPGSPIEEFLERHIETYSIDRFELHAVKVYYGKEIILTIYAVDKYRLFSETDNERVVVKKFKLPNIHLKDILECVSEFNFTLSTGKYPLENMVVINK